MKTLMAMAFAIGFVTATAANAQAPAGSTGICKDGTYTSAATKRGACAGHGGVKEWTAEKAEAAPTTPTTPRTQQAAPKTEAAPAMPTAPRAQQPAPKAEATTPPAPSEKSTATTKSGTTMAAAGGGPGQVWVNTRSKVYHCPGDKWYGKTKEGEYMTETAAKAAGIHPDHGKACS